MAAQQGDDAKVRKLAPSRSFRQDTAEGEGALAAGTLGAAPTRRRLVAFARRYVGDAAEAEDIAQETLLRAGTALTRLRTIERGEAWLFRICRHAAIDHVRARKVRRGVWGALPEDVDLWAAAPPQDAPADSEGYPPAGLERRGAGAGLAPARGAELRRIPAHHRVLLALHYAGGLSHAALCRLTGLSPSALRVRLFRARRSLASLVDQGRRAG